MPAAAGCKRGEREVVREEGYLSRMRRRVGWGMSWPLVVWGGVVGGWDGDCRGGICDGVLC